MVKNWADHCSSDEEDEEEILQEQVAVAEPPNEAPAAEVASEKNEHPKEEPPPRERQPRVYEYPSEPPFTAYVGNLAYSLTEADDLAAAVTDLAHDALKADIKVVHARVMKDRDNPERTRGFGYVEVEKVEMLQKLMELNEVGDAMIAGRRVQLDTASGGKNNRRGSNRGSRRGSSGFESIDGSKFRGGRHTTTTNNNNNNNNNKTESREPPAQRPSLKLKPRSKPLEDGATGSSASNIFGGATARDEQSWLERRNSEKQERRTSGKEDPQQQQQRRKSGQHHRGSGRGGRGGRESSEGRGGEGRGSASRNNKKPDKTEPAKPQTPPAAQPAPPEKPAPVETKKVTNAFSALAMDDSDSD